MLVHLCWHGIFQWLWHLSGTSALSFLPDISWYLLVRGKNNFWPVSLMNKIFSLLESSYMIDDACAKQKITIIEPSQYNNQAVGWKIWDKGKRFSPIYWDWCWASVWWVLGVLSLWVKWLRHEADQVKSEWGCTTLTFPHWMYLRSIYCTEMTLQ